VIYERKGDRRVIDAGKKNDANRCLKFEVSAPNIRTFLL
jgi:hypothetical protein